MSKSANDASYNLEGLVVHDTARKESGQLHDFPAEYVQEDVVCDFCDKHYNQLLPMIAEKVYQEKLKKVQAFLVSEKVHRKLTNSFGKELQHCARKGALIRSSTGIEADLGEHLAPMERPDKKLSPLGRSGRDWGVVLQLRGLGVLGSV
ncbi:hypothetical protein Tco_1299645 [Tanacetum coccineum]